LNVALNQTLNHVGPRGRVVVEEVEVLLSELLPDPVDHDPLGWGLRFMRADFEDSDGVEFETTAVLAYMGVNAEAGAYCAVPGDTRTSGCCFAVGTFLVY
jgi:hypothetical protein